MAGYSLFYVTYSKGIVQYHLDTARTKLVVLAVKMTFQHDIDKRQSDRCHHDRSVKCAVTGVDSSVGRLR